MSNIQIEGIPDGWELVRIGQCNPGETKLSKAGEPLTLSYGSDDLNCIILRKIEKPKRYRPFANAAECVANRCDGFAVDWKNNTVAPGFFAVVSANDLYVWVSFGDEIKRFEWEKALEMLEFRHIDNSTSPFGIEVAE